MAKAGLKSNLMVVKKLTDLQNQKQIGGQNQMAKQNHQLKQLQIKWRIIEFKINFK